MSSRNNDKNQVLRKKRAKVVLASSSGLRDIFKCFKWSGDKKNFQVTRMSEKEIEERGFRLKSSDDKDDQNILKSFKQFSRACATKVLDACKDLMRGNPSNNSGIKSRVTEHTLNMAINLVFPALKQKNESEKNLKMAIRAAFEEIDHSDAKHIKKCHDSEANWKEENQMTFGTVKEYMKSQLGASCQVSTNAVRLMCLFLTYSNAFMFNTCLEATNLDGMSTVTRSHFEKACQSEDIRELFGEINMHSTHASNAKEGVKAHEDFDIIRKSKSASKRKSPALKSGSKRKASASQSKSGSHSVSHSVSQSNSKSRSQSRSNSNSKSRSGSRSRSSSLSKKKKSPRRLQ